jgi:hypothetical protein
MIPTSATSHKATVPSDTHEMVSAAGKILLDQASKIIPVVLPRLMLEGAP